MITNNEQAEQISAIQSKLAALFFMGLFLQAISSFATLSLDKKLYDHFIFTFSNSQFEPGSMLYVVIVVIFLMYWFIYDRTVIRKSTGWALFIFLGQIILLPYDLKEILKSPAAFFQMIAWLFAFYCSYKTWRLTKLAKKIKNESISIQGLRNPGSQGYAYKTNPFEEDGAAASAHQPPLFKGDRNINNDEYQIYLSTKYDAKLNPLLGRYQFKRKLYSTLNELLTHLHEIDTTTQSKKVQEDFIINEFNLDVDEWFYKNQNGYFKGPKSLRFIASLNQKDYFFVRHISTSEDEFAPLFNILSQPLKSPSLAIQNLAVKKLIEIYAVSQAFINLVVAERGGDKPNSEWHHQNPMNKKLAGPYPLDFLLTYQHSENELVKHDTLPEFIPLGLIREIYQRTLEFRHQEYSRKPDPSSERSYSQSPNPRGSAHKSTKEDKHRAPSKKPIHLDLLVDPYKDRTGEFMIKITIGVIIFLAISFLIWGRK